MNWIKAHAEITKPDYNDWARDELGNHIADRLAGACLAEVSEITKGRAVHFTVTARAALLSLLAPQKWYIGDPLRGPALTIGEETQAWQDYLVRRDNYSTREGYWQDNTLPFAAEVFGMKYCTVSYAAKKIRILYDKRWYGCHTLKGLEDMEEEDKPEESFCPLYGIANSLRHWLAECQHPAMVACRC